LVEPPKLALSVIGTDWLLVTTSVMRPTVFTRIEPKDRGLGKTVTAFPLRRTVCGLPAALSFIESVPVRKPLIVGVK
jgi:hypothetical protein